MDAIVIDVPGGAEVLRRQQVPDAVAGPGEVLIQVAAAGVNRADVMQRQGFYDPPPGASSYPGLECSGTVAALGAGVTGWSIGTPCVALLSGGGYASLVAVPVGQVMPVPAGIDLISAAALPEVACTVWSNVSLTAALQPNEVLLVHGGSSGIGTMAIQLARAIGARVAVTAGSAQKLQRCAELGAEILVNYREEDFVEVVRAATDGHGADVILDVMGAKYLSRNVSVLANNGRLLVIGLQGGRAAELDLAALLAKRGAVIAASLRARPATEKAAICAAVVEHVWPLITAGTVRPVIDRVLRLDEAALAHEVMESSQHIGKILLAV